MIGFRADTNLRKTIEKWAKAQPDKPSLSDAVRRLVEIGLSGSTKAHPSPSDKAASNVKDLAAKAIDRLADPTAPAEEQARRKRRLLKGPEEFRDVRVDRAKAKK